MWFRSLSHLEGKTDFGVCKLKNPNRVVSFIFFFNPLQLPHVFVNCVEYFTSRLLLEEILIQLQSCCSETEQTSRVPCDTFNDFVRLFKQAVVSRELQDQTLYIVSNLVLLFQFRFG